MNGLESVRASIRPATQEIIEASYEKGINQERQKGWAVTVPTLVRLSPINNQAEVLMTNIYFSTKFSECIRAYNFWYKNAILEKKYSIEYADGALTLDCR